MLTNYLTYKIRPASTEQKFSVIDYDEKQSICDSTFQTHLGKVFAENVVDPNFIKEITQMINKPDLLKFFVTRAIPEDEKMKRGRYGEVLASELLQEFFNYEVPIHKLRYLVTSGQSLPATDILAIKRSEKELTEVCYVESKVRTSRNTTEILNGYKQLMEDKNYRLSEIIAFVMGRLYNENRDLLLLFTNYFGNVSDSKDTFRIFFFCEKDNWSETALNNLSDEIVSTKYPITVDVVRIKEIIKNMTEFYDFLIK